MEFNVNKCGVILMGKRNLELQYQMNDGRVKSVNEERDLGLEILKTMCIGKNKADLMLGIIEEYYINLLK